MSNRSGLMYRERLAAVAARDDLACVWMHSSGDDCRGYEHRTVPNGSVQVAFALGTNQITVTGPQRQPMTTRLEAGTTTVGIRFRPGAAAPILGVPVTELVDRTVGLEQLWGRAATRLAEQLAEISAPHVAASLLEKEISRRSPKAAYRDPIVLAAVDRLQPWHQHRTDGANPLSGLFISPRQLRRRFVLALGYGPRTLRRVLRFQGFLALSNVDREIGIGPLAHAAGFADQAHLTRECVRLTGLTPQLFIAETADCSDNHDHRASFAAVRRALLLERKSPP